MKHLPSHKMQHEAQRQQQGSEDQAPATEGRGVNRQGPIRINGSSFSPVFTATIRKCSACCWAQRFSWYDQRTAEKKHSATVVMNLGERRRHPCARVTRMVKSGFGNVTGRTTHGILHEEALPLQRVLHDERAAKCRMNQRPGTPPPPPPIYPFPASASHGPLLSPPLSSALTLGEGRVALGSSRPPALDSRREPSLNLSRETKPT